MVLKYYRTIGCVVSLSFPYILSKIVKNIDVQADKVTLPFAQCTKAANKAKRLISVIRR